MEEHDATAGRPLFAVLDRKALYVVGYFEETKLKRIHVGDAVHVKLMGEDAVIDGHVDSIASGIGERDTATSGDLLANPNPTFSWVRLAQRIPVRVTLDRIPATVQLVAGRTATVEVLPRKAILAKGALK